MGITLKEKEQIQKYFGMPLEDLNLESFKKIQKELRQKYHPDNFEKFEDEVVKEMATERFQTIEQLALKIQDYLSGRLGLSQNSGREGSKPFMDVDAVFAIRKLKIEINTADKDLKYHLFGTYYRWLVNGDSFKIPDTKASIIIDEDHRGRRIGFRESIRMYLTFGEEDAIEDIVEWLYHRIKDGADSLLIAGDSVDIDPHQILYAIRKQSFLRIGAPETKEE